MKLSERLPKVTPTLTQAASDWLKELAGFVEVVDKRDLAETHRLKTQLGRLSERLDALRGGYAEQPSVDRQLVEEALAMCQRFDSWLSVTQPVADIRELLRRALEGDQDAQD